MVLVNDTRDGYGVLYFDNGSICYKGNLSHNMTNGYGEEYDKDKNLIYKGQWKYNEKVNN